MLRGHPNGRPRLPVLGMVLATVASGCADLEGPPAAVQDTRRVCPEGAPATPEPDPSPLPLPTDMRHGTLPSGLRYYIWPGSRPAGRVSLRLIVKVGSAHERDGERGFAHLVEHLAFGGTRQLSAQWIADFQRKTGVAGRDSNAFTGRESTRYHFDLPGQDPALLNQGLLLLREVSTEVSFDPASVDRIRPSVIEEDRQNGARFRLEEQINAVAYRGSPYALPILGDVATLRKATPEHLRAFYDRAYRPDQTAVTVVGEVDAGAVEGEIRRLWGGLPPPAARAAPPPALPDDAGTQVVLLRDQQLSSTSVRLSYGRPVEPCSDRCQYRHQQLRSLVRTMFMARLDTLKLSQVPPFSALTSRDYRALPGSQAFELQLTVGEGAVLPGLETALREIERVSRHGFTPGELARFRQSVPSGYWQQIDPRAKTPEQLSDLLIGHIALERPLIDPTVDAGLLPQLLAKVTLCDLHAAMGELTDPRNRLVVVQGPPWADLPEEAEVRALLERTRSEPLADWAGRPSREKPVMRRQPTPGRVVEEKKIDEIGVVEWRLANGMRVLAKSTDVGTGQVQVTGFSPGGHSLVADADYPAALLADDVLNGSGFGDWSEGEVRVVLGGDGASFRLGLNEREEGFSGRAAASHLMPLFKMMHLALTEPRVDPQILERRTAVARANLRRSAIDPDAFLAGRWGEFYYQGHPRRRRLGEPDIARVSAAAVSRIHKQRFGILDDLVVVIVGPFNIEHLRPLVETYLGGLPTARTETARDVGARPRLGTHRLDVRHGDQPRARVQIDYTARAGEDRGPSFLIRSIPALLQTRLRNRLRETLGGVYSVSAETNAEGGPQPVQRVRVGFTCAPENADRLAAAAAEEAERARRQGFSAVEIENLRANWLRSVSATKSNDGWLRGLVDATGKGWDPRVLAEPARQIEQLDAANLQKAARTYLDPSNRIIAVVRPKLPEGGSARWSAPPAQKKAKRPATRHSSGRDSRVPRHPR